MIGFAVDAIVHWLSLAVLAAWIGTVVLERLILPPGWSKSPLTARRLRRANAVWVLGLILASLAQLAVRTHTMAGGGVVSTVAAVPTVLTRTHFGSIWIARLALLAVSVALTRLSSPGARSIELVLALAVAATTSLTGHAADLGDVSVRVFVDWVHVVSASAWAGGLIALAAVALRCPSDWVPEDLAATARRFSRLAMLALLGVVASGLYNAWIEVGSVDAMSATTYGTVLAVKLLVVVALIALAAVTRWGILPRLDRHRRPDGIVYRLLRAIEVAFRRRGRPRRAPSSRFSSYMMREAALAIAVFAITGVLTELTPAAHAAHGAPIEERTTPFWVGEEALHAEPGGVPRGWIFRPAPGNATRGRQLFRDLGCWGCHRVADENFPPPWHAGPDLTGMGQHHPAGYLAESIVNPNAVIVEGPGYTEDGRSAMPDYGDRLTVTDLDDLVAYLKTL